MEDPTAQLKEVVNDSAKPEGLLYHCTDQKGLLGILKDKCIWATHYRFLNDASERQDPLPIFMSRIISRLKSTPQLQGESRKIKELFYSKIIKNMEIEAQSVDAYYICFSQEVEYSESQENDQMPGDRLSQWRGTRRIVRDSVLDSKRDFWKVTFVAR
jgi:hypothetical protein